MNNLRDWCREAGLAAGLVCVAAHAQPQSIQESRYSLSWVRSEGAEQCPDSHRLQDEIEQRLGRTVFAGQAPLSLEIQVVREAGLFESALYLRDEHGSLLGRRLLHSGEASCEPIFSATVLAAALVIDPHATLGPVQKSSPGANVSSVPETTAGTAPPTGIESPPSGQRVPAMARYERRPDWTGRDEQPTVVVSLGALASAQVLPRPSPGVALAVEPDLGGGWAARLGAVYLTPANVVGSGTAHFRIGLTALALGVAWGAVGTRRYRLGVDVGLLTGALHATVLSPLPSDPGDFLFLGANGGVRMRWILGSSWLAGLAGHAVVPVLRRRFLVEGSPSAPWRQPAVGAVASLEVGAHFR